MSRFTLLSCAVAAGTALLVMLPGAALGVVRSAAPAPGAGPGYWLVGSDGGVFAFGRGAFSGGLAGRRLNAPIVGAALAPSGDGYWLAAADGGVFAFGGARWLGALPSGAAGGPVVAIGATPTGAGYWLVTRGGSVYTRGDAVYHGGRASPGPAPIVAMTPTPDGRGYWLAASDGSVYAYGDAGYLGGASGLAAPVVSMAATADGRGYWLAAADGGVFAYGDAPWFGSLAGGPHASIVGIAPLTRGAGYWLSAADGGVFTFGAAGYFGGIGASRLSGSVVAILSGDGTAIPRAQEVPISTSGFDISWPQCDRIRPAPPYGFGIVGVTLGHLFSANPCRTTEWNWATTYGSFGAVYVNTNAPTATEYASFMLGPAAHCGINAGCVLDLWGRLGAEQALRDGSAIPAPMWWLDVETNNQWLPDPAANAVVLRAMIDVLRRAHKVVGVYSTSYQWQKLVGGFAPGLPTWIAGGPVANTATYCDGQSFGGGVAWLVQSGDPNFDTDVLCPAGLANYKVAFARPAPFAVPRYSVAGVVSSAPTPAAPPTPPPARPAIALPPPVALPPARPPAGHGRGVPVDLLVGGVLMLVAGGVSRQRARSRE